MPEGGSPQSSPESKVPDAKPAAKTVDELKKEQEREREKEDERQEKQRQELKFQTLKGNISSQYQLQKEIEAKRVELTTAQLQRNNWLPKTLEPGQTRPESYDSALNKAQEEVDRLDGELKKLEADMLRKIEEEKLIRKQTSSYETIMEGRTEIIEYEFNHIIWYPSSRPDDPYEYSAKERAPNVIAREKVVGKDNEYVYWRIVAVDGNDRQKLYAPGQKPEELRADGKPFEKEEDPADIAKAQEIFIQQQKQDAVEQQERAKKLTVIGLQQMENEEDRRRGMEDILALPHDNAQRKLLMNSLAGRPKNEKEEAFQRAFLRLLERKKILIPVRKLEDIEKDVPDLKFGGQKIAAKDFIRNNFEWERMNFYMFWVERIMDTTGGCLLVWDIYKEKMQSKNEETRAVGEVIGMSLLNKADELSLEATEILRQKINEEPDPLFKKDLQKIVKKSDRAWGRAVGPVFQDDPQPVDADKKENVLPNGMEKIFQQMAEANMKKRMIRNIARQIEQVPNVDDLMVEGIFGQDAGPRRNFVFNNITIMDRIAAQQTVSVLNALKKQDKNGIPPDKMEKVRQAIKWSFTNIKWDNEMLASSLSDTPTAFDRDFLKRQFLHNFKIVETLDGLPEGTAEKWADILVADEQNCIAMHNIICHKVFAIVGTDDRETIMILNEMRSADGRFHINRYGMKDESSSSTADIFLRSVPITPTPKEEPIKATSVIPLAVAKALTKQPEEVKEEETTHPLKSLMQNTQVIEEGNVKLYKGKVGEYRVMIAESGSISHAYLETDTGEDIPLPSATVKGLNTVVLKRADESTVFYDLEKQNVDNPYIGDKQKDDILKHIFAVDQQSKVVKSSQIKLLSDGMHILFRNAPDTIKDAHPLRVLGIITTDDTINQTRAEEFQELFRFHMEEIRDWTFADMQALTKLWDKKGSFLFAPLVVLRGEASADELLS